MAWSFYNSSGMRLTSADHGTLSGLTDDDHTQYALLAGRSGGQTLIGGTGDGDTLSLQGSSHADGGQLTLNNDTLANSTNLLAGVKITPTMTGTGAITLEGIEVSPTFTPASGTLVVATALGAYPTLSPTTGQTISNAFLFDFQLTTGSGGGTLTNTTMFRIQAPSYGSVKPTTVYGIDVNNIGSASITTVVAARFTTPTGATNNYALEFSADATDPTGGGGAATGRIPCLIGGATRYLAYY